MTGRLIAFEGGEAVGKSTQAKLLAERLGALLTFEPGDTELGRQIRSLVLDSPNLALSPHAEALLMAADRAQHVAEVIRPALAAGTHVVTDRFIGSSLAYQGFGRDVGVEDVRAVSLFATGGLDCDLVVLLDAGEGAPWSRQTPPGDRIEAEAAEFHRRVLDGYRALAAQDPGRWAVVDGSGAVGEVAEAVYAVVRERLDV